MGVFSKIREAKPTVNANYTRQGHYLALIRECKTLFNRKKKEKFLVGMTCLHVYDNDEGKGHKVGEEFAHMMDAEADMFLGNVKSMLVALLGIKEDEVDEATCLEITGEGQPLAGMIVEIACKDIITKKGQPFTVVTYRCEVPPAQAEPILSQEIKDRLFPGDRLQQMDLAYRKMHA